MNRPSKAPVFKIIGQPPPVDRELSVGGRMWRIPEETPVAFVYNRRNYAVMLATPANFEDFAMGFSLTERIVDSVRDIDAAEIRLSARGAELHIGIDPACLERLDIRQQRRNLVGRAGCGVCGLENAETFFEMLPRVSEQKASISQAALSRALEAFTAHQPLNARTRTVHGAAWCALDGGIRLAREDVGRHNALDKLLGALAREGADFGDGFVMISSRCSYEIIEKSARVGVRAVASVSAPTSFAVSKAKEANIALYCHAGDVFVEAS